MTIDRRRFLKLAASAGLVVAAPPMLPRIARASGEGYPGPYWVTIHANGGWDPTMVCDPKGRANETVTDRVNNYMIDEIVEVGPFRAAPIEGVPEFFERYRSELLVINGIDTGTNSHDTGTRHVWSGSFDATMPSFSALVAASSNDRPALAFLTNGGYDVTDGLIAPTRIPSVGAVNEIAYPHRIDPNEPASTMLAPSAYSRIEQARNERLVRLGNHATLPREQRAMSTLYETRNSENEIARLAQALPEALDASGNALRRQAEIAVATFKAGLTISANLQIGGYDTHGNHDQNHIPRIQQLIDGVDYLMRVAEDQGIIDKMIVVIGSDFARTPWYNDTNGKDHWSITSMMMMGPGIRGGRVIGRTDERQFPALVDPSTLAISDGGIRITPGHIHASLRELAGVADAPVVAPYRVGTSLPLFT